MTQLHELLPNLYAFNVPSMAFGFMINNYGDESELFYMLDIEDIDDTNKTDEAMITKKLPTGKWSIICCSATATEEDAAKVVPKIHNYDPETLLDAIFSDVSIDSYVKTIASLIRSRGLDPAKNWLFLKLD